MVDQHSFLSLLDPEISYPSFYYLRLDLPLGLLEKTFCILNSEEHSCCILAGEEEREPRTLPNACLIA